ncbi:MAG TPA: acyloxyacyl hydrolase, partial [Vicinamibacteria bacterium]|nr:acyloxyacyl hydrolase [Vicinamibacteria bacterium]
MTLLPILALTLAVSSPAQESPEESPGTDLEKSDIQFGIVGSFGAALDVFDGVPDAELLAMGAHLGRVLTGAGGPGLLRGRLGVDLEILPLFLVFQDSTSYGLSFTLLGQYFFEVTSRFRPFATLGAGFLYSSEEIPRDTSRVNFTPQIGIGVRVPDGKSLLYSFEFRLHHISNADLVQPNPGINS